MKRKYPIIFLTTLLLGIVLITIGYRYEEKPRKIPFQNENEYSEAAPTEFLKKKNRKYIHFGVSISQTGRFSVEGENVIQGYDLWKDYANKKGGIKIGSRLYPVKITYYDDHSQIEKVKKNIQRLIVEDQVDLILGPFTSGFNLAASKITEKYGKIMIESGGASDSIFTRDQYFTFATQTSASWWFKNFFDMISQKAPSLKTYALITPDKLFTRSVAKGVQIWAATKDIQEVYYQIVDNETNNFIPYLLEMASKKPDIVILTSHYQDAVNFSIQISKIKELDPKIIVMTIGPSEIGYIKDVGLGSERMVGVTQWVAQSNYNGPVFGTPKDYVEAFVTKYGQPPTYQDAQSSATGVIYQLALEKCSSFDANQLVENLRNMDIETFYGRVKYDPKGMNIGHKMALVQVQNGQMKTIWPAEAAESNLMLRN